MYKWCRAVQLKEVTCNFRELCFSVSSLRFIYFLMYDVRFTKYRSGINSFAFAVFPFFQPSHTMFLLFVPLFLTETLCSNMNIWLIDMQQLENIFQGGKGKVLSITQRYKKLPAQEIVKTHTQSAALVKGGSPVPVGVKSSNSGRVKGNWFSVRGTISLVSSR